MPLVVDASVALAWCFEDEASPETDAALEQIRKNGAVVPSLWHLELAFCWPNDVADRLSGEFQRGWSFFSSFL